MKILALLECFIDIWARGLITEGTLCRMKFNPPYLLSPNNYLTITLKNYPKTCLVMRPFGQESGHLIQIVAF